MTSAVCTNSDVPRWFASQTPQRWFKARHTCSRVMSGFFPPEPIGLLGHEAHHQQAQDQVPHQGPVVAALEVAKADLRLADPEGVLHVPPPERHPEHLLARFPRPGHSPQTSD
jgi:hypothetical protein